MPDHAEIERAPLQRGDGVAEIRCIRDGAATRVAHLFQRTPCRVLFPRPAAGDPLTAVLLVTSGGLTGGDRVRIDLEIGEDATMTATSQAAEKFYRSLGPACRFDVAARLREGAMLEWLPQEMILFDRASVVRRTEIDLAPRSRFIAGELIIFGRLARGERFRSGLWHDGWRIRRCGRLLWADALRLDGDIAAIFEDRAGFDGADALATAILAADDAASHLELARALTEATGCRAGATLVNGLLLARFLGEAQPVRQAFLRYVGGIRCAAAGLPERLPPIWYN